MAHHLSSTTCARCRWATSPGRWPVSRIIFSGALRWGQNAAISASLSTRSRLVVSFLSTPEHGFAAMISCRTAQLKIALAAARTWFARMGAAMAAMAALTSARLMLPMSSLAQRGSRYLVTSASACRQLLFRLLACSLR